MKIIGAGAALLAAAGLLWAVQGKPINDTCPVKAGTPIKAGITAVYKGKTVGLCCGNCKGQFDSNPEKFVANIPGLAGPQPRTGLSSEADALKSGKEGAKPVVLLFGDAGGKTKLFSEMLGDPSLDESFGNVCFASVEYKKDGEDAKKYKVTSAPTLLILDSRGEAPKELKKLSSGSPAAVKAAIAAAIKAMK
jgi:YHS domain-containing protein